MNSVSVQDFQNDFSRLMRGADEGVTVTDNGKAVFTAFPHQLLEQAKSDLLGEYFAEKVEKGEIGLFEAIREEQKIMESFRAAKRDYEMGNTHELTPQLLSELQRQAKMRVHGCE